MFECLLKQSLKGQKEGKEIKGRKKERKKGEGRKEGKKLNLH